MTRSQKTGLFILLILPLATRLQAQVNPDPYSAAVSQRAADTIFQRSFAKMVAGTEDITSIANYISFVPTDGKFTFSGNSFFQTKNKPKPGRRPYEYFAVGFTGSGSIVGGTVATLFDQGKLNTATDLGLRLSWRMNTPNFGSIEPESQIMIGKRIALVCERDKKVDSLLQAISLLPDKIAQATLAIAELRRKTDKLVIDTASVRLLITSAITDSAKLKWTDSLMVLKNKVFTNAQKMDLLMQNQLVQRELYEVSLIDKNATWENRTPRQQELTMKYNLIPIGTGYVDISVNKIKKDYDDKIYAVEIARPVQGMRLNWLSLIGNWNRLSYRTYDNTLSYTDALNKHDFDGYTAGLQFNFYTFYKPVQEADLFNIALLFKKTNNLADLSTSKLSEETLVPNGSTTRKTNTDYNVYTDPVEIYNTIQLPVNYYHFFGSNLSYGWHAFGQADWRNTHKSIYDIGVGFIFGLNTAGSKRLFNIEPFVKYKDLGRDLVEDKTTSKWKQLQIGFSLSIPFMVYKN